MKFHEPACFIEAKLILEQQLLVNWQYIMILEKSLHTLRLTYLYNYKQCALLIHAETVLSLVELKALAQPACFATIFSKQA